MDRQENNPLIQRVYQIRHFLLVTCLIIWILANSYIDVLWLKFSIDSVHWPSTNGFIQQGQFLQNNTMQNRGPFFNKVNYEYTVENKAYSGGTLGAFQFNVLPYKDGTRIPVFYDPKNPQRSCLIKGVNALWLGLELVKLGGLWLLLICMNSRVCSAKLGELVISIFDLPKKQLIKQLNKVSFHTRSKE
jgi:hypothetical protein